MTQVATRRTRRIRATALTHNTSSGASHLLVIWKQVASASSSRSSSLSTSHCPSCSRRSTTLSLHTLSQFYATAPRTVVSARASLRPQHLHMSLRYCCRLPPSPVIRKDRHWSNTRRPGCRNMFTGISTSGWLGPRWEYQEEEQPQV